MKKIILKIEHFLVFSCSEATLRIEKNLNGEISLLESLRLKGHLAVCKWCRSYSQKSILIHRSLHKIFDTESEKSSSQPIDKERLKADIENKLKNNPS